jgi:tetratricopeptide (TPR) repeat protein
VCAARYHTHVAATIALNEAAQAAAARGFGIETQPDADTGTRGRVYIRRDLGIESFGVNAFYQANAGAIVVQEHDELGVGASRHEELYVVVEGGCTFVVDGETVDAPRGTAIFARPESRRSARATEDGTIVLVVGGRPGEAFRVGPGEALGSFFRDYRDGNYEAALAACRSALELHPGNPMILYNVACLESLLGRPEEALDALGDALAASPDFKDQAAADDSATTSRSIPAATGASGSPGSPGRSSRRRSRSSSSRSSRSSSSRSSSRSARTRSSGAGGSPSASSR